jgi:hypothetical protein
MAYNFFPTSEEDIDSTLKTKTKAYRDNCKAVFKFLRKKYATIATPINIDADKGPINVVRAIKGSLTEQQIITQSGVKQPFKVKFGDGSSGNRGAANRGNAFEEQFTQALKDWRAGETTGMDRMVLETIEGLDKTYGIGQGSDFKVDAVGGENTKRPLSFIGGIKLTNTKGIGNDIGAAVTDITVTWKDKNKIAQTLFLSLKFESTVTFFNVGVQTILTKKEIQAGSITNNDGQALLDLFKIDHKKFCDIFNGTGKGEIVPVVSPNLLKLKALLESGIGYGYHVIHKFPGKIKSYKVDEVYMRSGANALSQTIYYGGKGGKGKRIDIVIDSPKYEFKLNIRDSQGKEGFPSRLMCDFKYKQ